jgi:hypothetical protein
MLLSELLRCYLLFTIFTMGQWDSHLRSLPVMTALMTEITVIQIFSMVVIVLQESSHHPFYCIYTVHGTRYKEHGTNTRVSSLSTTYNTSLQSTATRTSS